MKRPLPASLAMGLVCAVIGAATGALAHYVCWYLVLAGAATCHALTGGCTDSLGATPMTPIEALAGAGVYSLFSLLFFGWLTVPGGALVGGLLARAQGRSADPATPS